MSQAHEHFPGGQAGPSSVAHALAALATDLNDRLSVDREGLFRVLRADATRIALFNLLARLPPPEAADILRWVTRHTPRADSAAVMLRAGLSPAGGRLAAAERRAVFDRILAPERLALLLDLLQPTGSAKEAN